MLRRMNHTFAASTTLLALMILGGCSGSRDGDRAAADFLGAESVYVLSAPDRVWGWNFQRADGSIATDPPIKLLDTSVGQELGRILLSEETYRKPAKGGTFERSVGFRLVRGGQSVEVYPSFVNDQLLLRYTAPGGAPVQSSAGMGAARDRILKVAKQAFPEYRPPK
jgi:hypothetical protein